MIPEYPFIEHTGKMYYVTERLPRKGDFVYFDYEGTRKFGYIEYIVETDDEKVYFVYVGEYRLYFALNVDEITVLNKVEPTPEYQPNLHDIQDQLLHLARKGAELERRVSMLEGEHE